jgi:hypothetical protein
MHIIQFFTKDRHMTAVISKKSLVVLTLSTAMVSIFAAVPAQASPAANCDVSASFDGYCVLQPGATISGELKAGNGGAGGVGGRGGNYYGGGVGGTGGTGGVGGAGAKIPYSYTNTSGTAIALHFAIGVNGIPGLAGSDGVDGLPFSPSGLNGQFGLPGGTGSVTLLENNSVPLYVANAGTGGQAGTGGLAGGEAVPGVNGTNGDAGVNGTASTLSTTWLEVPFASIISVAVPTVTPEPAPELAVTGAHDQNILGTGLLMATLLTLGSALLVLRRRIASKK